MLQTLSPDNSLDEEINQQLLTKVSFEVFFPFYLYSLALGCCLYFT